MEIKNRSPVQEINRQHEGSTVAADIVARDRQVTKILATILNITYALKENESIGLRYMVCTADWQKKTTAITRRRNLPLQPTFVNGVRRYQPIVSLIQPGILSVGVGNKIGYLPSLLPTTPNYQPEDLDLLS
jgi:hypothetical protein